MSPSEAIGSIAERGAAEFDPKVAASAIVLQLRIVI
jgi:hypothetical protein